MCSYFYCITSTVQIFLNSQIVTALPVPEVEIVVPDGDITDNSHVTIEWRFPATIPSRYSLRMCIVNVLGEAFSNDTPVNSNISFEAKHPDVGLPRAVQHCWNVTEGTRCDVRGLKPGECYK